MELSSLGVQISSITVFSETLLEKKRSVLGERSSGVEHWSVDPKVASSTLAVRPLNFYKIKNI